MNILHLVLCAFAIVHPLTIFCAASSSSREEAATSSLASSLSLGKKDESEVIVFAEAIQESVCALVKMPISQSIPHMLPRFRIPFAYAAILEVNPNNRFFSPFFVSQTNDVYGATINQVVEDKMVIGAFDMSTERFEKQKNNLLRAYCIMGVLKATFFMRNIYIKRYWPYIQYSFLNTTIIEHAPPILQDVCESYFLTKRDTR